MTNQQNQSNKTATEMGRECPACGAMVRPRALFCHKCGRPVPELDESPIVEKNVNAPIISSDWFAPTLHTQNLESEIEGSSKPAIIEESQDDNVINPTTELANLPAQTEISDTKVAEVESRVKVEPMNESLPETVGHKEVETLKKGIDDEDFSETINVENKVVPPIIESETIVETKPKDNVELVKTPVIKQETAKTAKPKTQDKPSRRAAKQTELVWEESNAPTLRFLLGALILIAFAAFIFWTSYMLK